MEVQRKETIAFWGHQKTMKMIAFEMERMSTSWGRTSGDSKNMEKKIRKKKIHCTERKELDFTIQ